jgi:hypothetical protein
VTPTGPDRANTVFADIVAEELTGPGVTFERVLRNEGLKVDGKLYAFVSRGRLVVKLPADRCRELVTDGRAEVFEPSPGRRMREWVAFPAPGASRGPHPWPRLVDEARAFVTTVPARPRRPRKAGPKPAG